jgi:hypothetical protein
VNVNSNQYTDIIYCNIELLQNKDELQLTPLTRWRITIKAAYALKNYTLDRLWLEEYVSFQNEGDKYNIDGLKSLKDCVIDLSLIQTLTDLNHVWKDQQLSCQNSERFGFQASERLVHYIV